MNFGRLAGDMPVPVVSQVDQMLRRQGRAHRRAWVGHGRAHIEVKTLRRPGSQDLGDSLERALARVDGVHWAKVNAVVGRVIVAFDGDSIDLDDLVDRIESVEETHGVEDQPFSFERPDHPSDSEPIRRALTALAADAAGLGLSLFGAVLRATPIPVELASVFSLIDGEPRLRRLVENRMGPAGTDLGFALVGAAVQALSQGPVGLVVDGCHRMNLMTEAQARQRAWKAVEPSLTDRAGEIHEVPLQQVPRPRPLPGGPVEHYADRAALAGLTGFSIASVATGSVRRGAALLLAGIAKPARLGRESFAAHLGRTLSDRAMLVIDPTVLRRLDRVDTVVLTAGLALTGAQEVERLELVGEADALEVHQRLRSMLDLRRPDHVQQRGTWSCGPEPDVPVRRSAAMRRAVKALEAGHGSVYTLARGERAVAVFSLRPAIDPAATDLLATARRAGHMVVVASDDSVLAARLKADLVVPGGPELAASVRMLQDDGCSVVLVCGPRAEALRAADCGIGVSTSTIAAWGGHILVDGLDSAAFVLDATGVARDVSRQSAMMALAASGVASVVAMTAPPRLSSPRAMLTVNLAALVSMTNGTRAAVALSHRPRRRHVAVPPWHELRTEEVLALLAKDDAGTGSPPADFVGGPKLMLRSVGAELANPLTPLLAGGAALSAALGSGLDAGIVAGVSGINTLIGAAQRYRAETAVQQLFDRSSPMVKVRSGDRLVTVPGDLLTPGSVVVLESGDIVPADCRILEAEYLEVDESSLTGESLPVAKQSDPLVAPLVAERSSMLYEGTTVSTGMATAVVVAVGSDTEAAAGESGSESLRSGGGVEAHLGRLMAAALPAAALGGGAVVALGLLHGRPLRETLGAGTHLAVAAVPEGLPVVATLAQMAAARRLSVRGALARNPRALEALGRVEVLCTDKTGTLTEGRIELHSVSDGRHVVDGENLTALTRAVVAGALRATPAFTDPLDLPHLTDRAVANGAQRAGVPEDYGVAHWARREELPFDPSRAYHATLGSTPEGALLSVKGAPEIVLPRCTRWTAATGHVRLDAASHRTLHNVVDGLARRGLRVLAVAERLQADPSTASVEDESVTGLTLLGFVALSDPVRPEAASAVDSIRRAGIDVVMVTGDHPSTAEGIAAELGILNGHRVMTGGELLSLGDDELDAVLNDVSVFARVAPADKVRIVAAFQRAGRPVAMTGDGANDAPAIRLADVGIALGDRSTQAARAAADIIVTDDRVETVVKAIIEGRAMWASVRDALAILIGGNLGEIGFTVMGTAVSGRPPLTTRQILIVNTLTDVLPAMVIAMRPPSGRSPEALLAEGPDRSLGASLRNAILVRAAATASSASAAWLLASATGSPQRARTVGLVALVGSQLIQTALVSGGSPLVLVAAAGSSVALAGIVQTPVVSQFFGCTPLDPLGWATAIGAAVAVTGAMLMIAPLVRGIAHQVQGSVPALVESPPMSLVAPPGEDVAGKLIVVQDWGSPRHLVSRTRA